MPIISRIDSSFWNSDDLVTPLMRRIRQPRSKFVTERSNVAYAYAGLHGHLPES